MTFRREAFDRHRFDEWYGTSGSSACEELDFCARLSADGYRLVYNPRASVVHKRTVSGDSRTRGPNYDNVSNLTYFVLETPKLGLTNYLLFVGAMLAYAALKRDPGYLDGVRRGTAAYLRARRESDTDEGGDREP
jgi:GT2 family glycosyltransferase